MNGSIEQALAQAMGSRSQTVALDAEGTANGLLKLALTIVRFLHDVLEKQAIARMEAGRLDDDQIERIGTCLMRQAQQIAALCEEHGIDPDELELDLGPLGRLWGTTHERDDPCHPVDESCGSAGADPRQGDRHIR